MIFWTASARWLLPLQLLLLLSLGSSVRALLLFQEGCRRELVWFAVKSGAPTRSRGTAPPRQSIPPLRESSCDCFHAVDASAGLHAANGASDDHARFRTTTLAPDTAPDTSYGTWSFPPWTKDEFDDASDSIFVPHWAETPESPATAAHLATPVLWRPLLRLGMGTHSPAMNGSPNLVDYKLEWTVPPPAWQDGLGGVSCLYDHRERLHNLLHSHSPEQRPAPPFSEAQIRELATSMHAFETWIHRSAPIYCSATTTPSSTSVPVPTIRARLRLVVSRGSAATKCPRFHIDHVPFRWIQSLVGPGCVVVMDPSSVHWSLDKDDNDNDDDPDERWTAHEWNRRLLRDAPPGAVQRVPEGQAAILLGNRWREWALRLGTGDTATTPVSRTAGMSSSTTVPRPVLHKSPSLRLPWHGRVLLTLDVVTDDLLL